MFSRPRLNGVENTSFEVADASKALGSATVDPSHPPPPYLRSLNGEVIGADQVLPSADDKIVSRVRQPAQQCDHNETTRALWDSHSRVRLVVWSPSSDHANWRTLPLVRIFIMSDPFGALAAWHSLPPSPSIDALICHVLPRSSEYME